MKIAVFHELAAGGARNAVNEIAKRLKKKNVVDLYLVDDKKKLIERSYYSSVHFYTFIPKNWQGGNWRIRLYKDTIELYSLYKLHKKIAKDIKKRSYDILLVNASKFIESPFILRFFDTIKVFYLHDPHYRFIYENFLNSKSKTDIFRQVYDMLNRYIRKKIDKKNLEGAQVFLANSEFTKKQFAKTYGKESFLAYLGTDTDFFTYKNIKKEFDILYIGSYEPVDGYELIETSLRFIKIKPKISSVIFEKEWLSGEKIRSLYQRSKIVVCLAYNEPFGMVALEAMACEVPVVAVDEGGYKETVVSGKTGYLVQRDPKSIAEKIEFLLSNESTRLKMGKNARFHVLKNWTWEKSINKLEKILERIIRK